MTALAILALALAGLFAAMAAANLRLLAPPGPTDPRARPAVSILVPARDEEANIAPLLASLLATEGAEIEVVVLDDGSTDRTAALVREAAARDGRVRLIEGAPLPAGWVGKAHACWQLAAAARHPLLCFVDADVRVAPDAVARLAGFVATRGLGLASGFPRQQTGSLAEAAVVPQIMVVLLGYLPLAMARREATDPRFAAACGQLLVATRAAYEAAGGHAALRGTIHDGIGLARAVRRAGFATDLCDLAPLATCRMYADWPSVWSGFSKNAREGMATPRGLPVWTLLLGGGHLLPLALVVTASGAAWWIALAAAALSWGMAAAVMLRSGAAPVSALLHPAGVAATLAIQWTALLAGPRRRPAVWRGRRYEL